MQELRQRYTRIVIDTPPVLGLSEAASLQRVVDGTVMVVLAERTPQRDIHQALDLLRKSGGRLYGFILNRLDLKKAANYYHYSYYSPYYYDALPNEA
jgi:Mrp family chromosome partitioning ATPase